MNLTLLLRGGVVFVLLMLGFGFIIVMIDGAVSVHLDRRARERDVMEPPRW